MQREEILTGVCECIADALDIAEDDIHENSKLIEELGADSLDLLDLIFQIEQKFKIKLSVREFEKYAKERLGDIPLENDGVYTSEAIALIRQSMPEVPEEELPEGLAVQGLPRRFRVATFINLVERALEATNV